MTENKRQGKAWWGAPSEFKKSNLPVAVEPNKVQGDVAPSGLFPIKPKKEPRRETIDVSLLSNEAFRTSAKTEEEFIASLKKSNSSDEDE